MRRLVATVCVLLLLASCGRGVGRAVGTTIGLTGGAAIITGGTGMAIGVGSGDPYAGAIFGGGAKLALIGLALFTAGGIIIKAENNADEKNERAYELAAQHAESERRQAEEPPPPPPRPSPRLSADDPRRTGVWREVPPVYGDDGAE